MSTQGSFYWNELATKDTGAAAAFYTNLLGWTTQEMPMGDGRSYTMWLFGGQPVGGMFPAKGAPFEDEKPAWLSYVAVDDIDATVAKVEGLGGTVLAAPGDIPDVGRIAVVADPQGAVLALIKPTQGQG